jgi:hypothetical protein
VPTPSRRLFLCNGDKTLRFFLIASLLFFPKTDKTSGNEFQKFCFLTGLAARAFRGFGCVIFGLLCTIHGMSVAPGLAWPFDRYVEGVSQYGGYRIIKPDNAGAGVIGGVSFLGPKLPALTVDPSQSPRAYMQLLELARARWHTPSDEPPRSHFLGAVVDTVSEALPYSPEEFDAFIGSVAGRQTVDLGEVFRANAGDGRSQALAAAFLIQSLAPHYPVGVDQNVVIVPGVSAMPQAWARYRDLGDALTSGFLHPLATVIVNPLNDTADTLWATWRGQQWSPYARPHEVNQLAELAQNQVVPVVRDMTAELGSVSGEPQRSTSFLATPSGATSPYLGGEQAWHFGKTVIDGTAS